MAGFGTYVLALWPWLFVTIVMIAAVAGLTLITYRRKGRKLATAVAGIAAAWVLGLAFAFAQLVPGVTDTLPSPFSLEGQDRTREVGLQEARQAADFYVFAPSYLPSRFKLESVRIEIRGASSVRAVVMTYFDRRSSSELEIRQTATTSPTVTPGQANARVMGQYAKIASTQDLTTIEWSYGSTRIEMSGGYGKTELLKLAQSMR